jgi:hypothetical protein
MPDNRAPLLHDRQQAIWNPQPGAIGRQIVRMPRCESQQVTVPQVDFVSHFYAVFSTSRPAGEYHGTTRSEPASRESSSRKVKQSQLHSHARPASTKAKDAPAALPHHDSLADSLDVLALLEHDGLLEVYLLTQHHGLSIDSLDRLILHDRLHVHLLHLDLLDLHGLVAIAQTLRDGLHADVASARLVGQEQSDGRGGEP